MARSLDASEASLFGGMLRRIRQCERRNVLRRNLHDANFRLDKVGFSVPPHMVDFQTPLGWGEKVVSVPAARIYREGFRLPGDSTLLDDLGIIFDGGYTARLEAGAVKSSLRHGPAFMFVTPGDEAKGEPPVIFSAKSALEATCVQDPRTGVVNAGLELVARDEALLYVPGNVLELRQDRGEWMVVEEYPQPHDLVLCEPFVWDWDLDRPFGRSRITRPLIGFIQAGVRTMLRQEVTAEFFSAPQRSLLGASEEHFTGPDGKAIDLWKAITGGVWALPDVYDEEEGKLVRAQLQQLQQASMQPHSEMFESIALKVSSESSLPIGYLGVVQNQPSAEGAIKVAEVDMVELIEAQIRKSYQSASENLARKALAVYHKGLTPAMSKELRGLSARYAKPGTPTESARADAALKYATAFPNGDPKLAMEMYGLSDEQIKRNTDWARSQQSSGVLDKLIASRTPPPAADAAVAVADGAAAEPSADESATANAAVLKAKFDALGVAVRAGVEPADAAKRLGLDGIEFTGATPASLRLPVDDAADLEAR